MTEPPTPRSRWLGLHTFVLAGAVAGVTTGALGAEAALPVARAVIKLFMNVLKLVSLPVIFLALFTTICGMETVQELKWLGRKVITYTLSTTVIAASIGLGLFFLVRPVGERTAAATDGPTDVGGYLDHVLGIIPSHVYQPFAEGNVIGVLILAVAFGLAILTVEDRALVHRVSNACLAALMKIVRTVIGGVPVVVWAGVVVSFEDLSHGASIAELARYLACVVLANLLQGLVVLPLFLKSAGVAPLQAARNFFPALSVAFFTKSSVATIPVAIRTAEEKLDVHPAVSRFTFPICTTINMNACAAFILITVLYVSMSHGRVFTPLELGLWVFVATLAAVGNAGVPMGCYFLSSAILATMGVPVEKMALILPFYSFLDMLETAINVWSDGCVAMLVSKQYRAAT